MGIAFFDLDRTLISKNSGALWMKKEIRERRLSVADAFRAVYGLGRYALGFVDLEPMIRLAISRLEGTPESDLRGRVYAFYEDEVAMLYRPGARRALDDHRAKGDRLVLLTSASLYLSERVSQTLELDDILCNRFEVGDDGRFSGRPEGPICFGEGKLVLARALAERLDVALAECHFYTDSMADAPVLEEVGHAVAVNPDPRLSRLAEKRSWRVEDWGR